MKFETEEKAPASVPAHRSTDNSGRIIAEQSGRVKAPSARGGTESKEKTYCPLRDAKHAESAKAFVARTYSFLVRDKAISHGAFRLWHLLRDYCGKKGYCWPSLKHLSTDLGSNTDRVSKWRNELVEAGYLKVKAGGPRTSSRYTLLGGSYIPGTGDAASPEPGMELTPAKRTQQEKGKGDWALTRPEQKAPEPEAPEAPKDRRPDSAREVIEHALTRAGFVTSKVLSWLERLDLNRPADQILPDIFNEDHSVLRDELLLAFNFLHYNNNPERNWNLTASWRAAFDGFRNVIENHNSIGPNDTPCGWVPHVAGREGWPEDDSEADPFYEEEPF